MPSNWHLTPTRKLDPLAYFYTWTTYGTWLPGDGRGWFRTGGGFQLPNKQRHLAASLKMSEDAIRLGEAQRQLVESTIKSHCQIRNWNLHAVNCRTNHVHVVVTARDEAPTAPREQFKAWASRRLREMAEERRDNAESNRQHWWTERGWDEFLDDENAVMQAIHYVRDLQ